MLSAVKVTRLIAPAHGRPKPNKAVIRVMPEWHDRPDQELVDELNAIHKRATDVLKTIAEKRSSRRKARLDAIMALRTSLEESVRQIAAREVDYVREIAHSISVSCKPSTSSNPVDASPTESATSPFTDLGSTNDASNSDDISPFVDEITP